MMNDLGMDEKALLVDVLFSRDAIVPSEVITPDGEVMVPQDTVERNADYDYEKTRSNLHNLLQQGQDALINALSMAKQSESARAFEVVGNLIKQLADINHQLLDLSEKRQKLKTKEVAPVQGDTINNTLYITTTELNKMLKNKGE